MSTHTTGESGQLVQLNVGAPGGDYPILLGRGLLDRLGELAAGRGLGRQVLVASDSNVAPLYSERVMRSLRGAGFEPSLSVMPAGEMHKNWASVSNFLDACVESRLARDGWVLALGGGVVGDTAGFAASVYMRGVALMQVPTTLLAMADSSIGGKVGVDHPGGKNLLGAFKQPALVVADLDTLGTLPQLQVACGIAEIIKAGVIGDPELFAYLERTAPEEVDYRAIVEPALRVKQGIVESDPYEAGVRAHLNLGHTFGHAFESCTGYTRPHGVAVAQGMVVAFDLAGKLRMCERGAGERLRALLERWGLPSRWGSPDLADEGAPRRVYLAMAADKKRRDAALRLVLPEAVGRVTIVSAVPEQLILQALEVTQ